MAETVEGELVVDEQKKTQAIEQHQASQSLARADELTVDQLMGQIEKVQDAMKRAMRNDEHYGVIPGTNKPTLLKPGAEKLCLLFRLAPTYIKAETWHDNGHYTASITCRLIHITTGDLVAEGEGLCSTMEAKYAWRNDQRKCPSCGKPAIIKGKAEYGGGWLCFKRKDGCGAKFGDNDPQIVNQSVGKIPNPDLADTYNTVLKMACKRALVAAVLNGTAASDIFTQDIEEKHGDIPTVDEDPLPVEPVQPPDRAWLDALIEDFGDDRVLEVSKELWPTQGIWTTDNLLGMPESYQAALLEALQKAEAAAATTEEAKA